MLPEPNLACLVQPITSSMSKKFKLLWAPGCKSVILPRFPFSGLESVVNMQREVFRGFDHA